MNNSTTQFWKDETIHQANALAEREDIYRRGFEEGLQKSKEKTLAKVLSFVDDRNLGGQLNWLVEEIKSL